MQMMNTNKKWLMLLALLPGPLVANAEAVTYAFTGAVSATLGTYDSVAIGTPLSGTYTFDLAAGDPAHSSGSIGSSTSLWLVANGGGPIRSTPLPKTIIGLGVSYTTPAIGGEGTSSGVSGFNLVDSSLRPNAYDGFEMHTYTPTIYSDSYLNLAGRGAPYTSDGLPNLSLATVFATGEFDVINGNGLDSQVKYKITSLKAVPLPAAAWLLLSALGGICFFSRSRANQLSSRPGK
jgi:hypothetical protein